METVFLGVGMFTIVVIALVILLLIARSYLVSSGSVTITINGKKDGAIQVPAGGTLLSTLADRKIFVPSACGGGGTCAQCMVQVDSGGGTLLPTEEGHINRGMAKEHYRLACQVKVKQDMDIRVPDSVFSVQKWECEVVSNDNVATFIKEFKVRLPKGQRIDFVSGDYIQIEIPPYDESYKTMDVQPEYREDWDKFDLWRYKVHSETTIERAYSMANYPAEGDDLVMLNVRIASPPPRQPDVTPGIGSSYIFNRKPGDKVMISGPFGEFHIQKTNREMVFIGGGAGMAPLRSHIMRLLVTDKTDRKMSFWYGARSVREMFYVEDFDKLAAENPNFEWHVALSEPQPEDNWSGYTGFIHQVVLENYLSKHPAPEDIEYYLCGPPMMNSAVLKMLDDLGVEPEMIRLDDFGG
ncbi:MAG: NADH:ubiquinone reductase (Na(+)-transporting) subunit F [Planctomycetes bacterium]|nr:NADH:ubiquinone reductase (Na(+)-transporting) subunit F [Planctomycetota bacterium]MCB9913141.1 NADH:ubiquinone reductase (Na(+)-transporting) subunit F [Planctomycetota bacterium]HPF13357.1 NADH:ubiquinone reductase (Na(+)-transporting) subunit F [Planctomycetota bacterium]HRV80335.1 NADH:ubiquinone reductase (Na(+)-transporting) subunit F [Planctomycetota bacterium]